MLALLLAIMSPDRIDWSLLSPFATAVEMPDGVVCTHADCHGSTGFQIVILFPISWAGMISTQRGGSTLAAIAELDEKGCVGLLALVSEKPGSLLVRMPMLKVPK